MFYNFNFRKKLLRPSNTVFLIRSKLTKKRFADLGIFI